MTDMTPELDAAVNRNVALVLQLRRTIAALHRLDPTHRRFGHWSACPHAECRRVVDLLAMHFVCETCGGTFRIRAGGHGRLCATCNDLGRDLATWKAST